MLKILDNKCKMSPEQKEAMQVIYEHIKHQPGELFDNEVHSLINSILNDGEPELEMTISEAINKQRVAAERLIPKPVMKAYKKMLRESLFSL